MLYQLSYSRPNLETPGSEAQVVERGGFEPPKAQGRQVYSLLRLTASLPLRAPKRIQRSRFISLFARAESNQVFAVRG